ncbi:recombination protein RecR [Acetobacter pasteurianus]|uniref:Recombination protein RecR n=8 Tax=Acetobacter TaxID=434 RepID=A0A1Y0XXF6_ACEPA|nr:MULTISPECIES: recombination mediator RecR [Acetobacter]KDE21441.1 recombinase RecR [Acetobacter aceti 1023]BAU37132.1 recombination protein RecR [Acetobacter pasteurianus NBRC 101655]AKR48242.1 recombination protein RecR [Acetobacter pasteurianus]ARW10312.1 Recombination protein RecR [Acetobacter ascendens]ARW47593.1 Recombination protein RecR [Acetobacter pasteurianus subsp. pasteurianus]
MGGQEIEQLIRLLGRLPGFGPRSARRVALYLLKEPQTRLAPLAHAMERAGNAIKTCSSCGNLDTIDPCHICSDPLRDQGLICVVETVGDLWALERAGVHRGVYQVLGGTLSPLAGIGPEDLDVAPLFEKLNKGTVREIILALGATVEGATTMHWLMDQLAPYGGVTVSRVAQGVPMGGALDVLDDGTLAAALGARRPA